MKVSELIVKLEDVLWSQEGWRDADFDVDLRLSGEAGPLTTIEVKTYKGVSYVELGCDE